MKEKLESAAHNLLSAERLIEVALRDCMSQLRSDQVGRLNTSLRFVSTVRESIQYQANAAR